MVGPQGCLASSRRALTAACPRVRHRGSQRSPDCRCSRRVKDQPWAVPPPAGCIQSFPCLSGPSSRACASRHSVCAAGMQEKQLSEAGAHTGQAGTKAALPGDMQRVAARAGQATHICVSEFWVHPVHALPAHSAGSRSTLRRHWGIDCRQSACCPLGIRTRIQADHSVAGSEARRQRQRVQHLAQQAAASQESIAGLLSLWAGPVCSGAAANSPAVALAGPAPGHASGLAGVAAGGLGCCMAGGTAQCISAAASAGAAGAVSSCSPARAVSAPPCPSAAVAA